MCNIGNIKRGEIHRDASYYRGILIPNAHNGLIVEPKIISFKIANGYIRNERVALRLKCSSVANKTSRRYFFEISDASFKCQDRREWEISISSMCAFFDDW